MSEYLRASAVYRGGRARSLPRLGGIGLLIPRKDCIDQCRRPVYAIKPDVATCGNCPKRCGDRQRSLKRQVLWAGCSGQCRPGGNSPAVGDDPAMMRLFHCVLPNGFDISYPLPPAGFWNRSIVAQGVDHVQEQHGRLKRIGIGKRTARTKKVDPAQKMPLLCGLSELRFGFLSQMVALSCRQLK